LSQPHRPLNHTPPFYPRGYVDRQISDPRGACRWSLSGQEFLLGFLVNNKALPLFLEVPVRTGFISCALEVRIPNWLWISSVPQTQSSDFENYREDQGAFGGLFVDVAF
jgi:hypothetical protein